MNYRDIAVKAAKQAGDYLFKEFSRGIINWRLKQPHEIVTKADLFSEKIILSVFKKYTPSFSILSEESGLIKQNTSLKLGMPTGPTLKQRLNTSDYLWIVDPLDGTTNFRVHNPLFSVSIALYYKKEPLLGVVFVPHLKEMYTAIKDKGAYLNGQRIKVSAVENLKKSFLAYCYGSEGKHMRRAVELYRYFKLISVDMRQLGSAAVELAWVASGRLEGLIIPGTKPWDAAAGALLVQEAGGRVTDFNNKAWSIYSRTGKILPNIDLLASNSKVHKIILKQL